MNLRSSLKPINVFETHEIHSQLQPDLVEHLWQLQGGVVGT